MEQRTKSNQCMFKWIVTFYPSKKGHEQRSDKLKFLHGFFLHTQENVIEPLDIRLFNAPIDSTIRRKLNPSKKPLCNANNGWEEPSQLTDCVKNSMVMN